MISLENVSFSYDNEPVLENFSFRLERGCICLNGPSGCGKTTILRLLLGLERPQGGKIVCPEQTSVVFQEDRLLPWLTLADNVCLPLPKEKRDEAKKLLNEIGLAESADKYPAAVSGGMRRRVALVRALAYAGDALLLDEPFNGLDAENRALAAAMVRREFLDRGKPVLLISHIPEDAELLNAETVYMK